MRNPTGDISMDISSKNRKEVTSMLQTNCGIKFSMRQHTFPGCIRIASLINLSKIIYKLWCGQVFWDGWTDKPRNLLVV